MLAALGTSTQYWHEPGEMEGHSILVAAQIGTDSLESKLGTGVKGLQRSFLLFSGKTSLRKQKDCE